MTRMVRNRRGDRASTRIDVLVADRESLLPDLLKLFHERVWIRDGLLGVALQRARRFQVLLDELGRAVSKDALRPSPSVERDPASYPRGDLERMCAAFTLVDTDTCEVRPAGGKNDRFADLLNQTVENRRSRDCEWRTLVRHDS